MSQYKQNVINYGNDVNDFENSPFESLRMLHDRSLLHKVQDELTFDERLLLGKYDLKLIEHAEEMVIHISKIYDFNLSEKNGISVDEWWWYLDKIADGHLNFGISTKMGKVM